MPNEDWWRGVAARRPGGSNVPDEIEPGQPTAYLKTADIVPAGRGFRVVLTWLDGRETVPYEGESLDDARAALAPYLDAVKAGLL